MKSDLNTGNNRFSIQNYLNNSFQDDIRKDALRGFTSSRKYIPSKYFYDERGSKLFEEICELPEYYPTRTELSILENAAPEIMSDFQSGDLIELGSGSNRKIRLLMDAACRSGHSEIRYIPVDVSETILKDASYELLAEYPDISVLGIVADFIHHVGLIPDSRPKLIIFFGSTIGNLNKEESLNFLKTITNHMTENDRFIFGLDMMKPVEHIEAAYNDSRGVTSEFNKNILHVVNRELNAGFNLSDFDHLAFFNNKKEQVEMHLKTRRSIKVEISDLELVVEMEEGETIHTEICRKFSRERAEDMISAAGMKITRWFFDAREWFSLVEVQINNQ